MLIRVQRRYRLTYNLTSFYISQVVVCIIFIGYGIFALRGHNAAPEAKALTVADARKYVRPCMEQLVLSNPFCIVSAAIKPERLTAATTGVQFSCGPYNISLLTKNAAYQQIYILTTNTETDE